MAREVIVRPSATFKTNVMDSPPEFLDSAAFDAADFARGWLVEQVLVRGQPGVIGGAKKTLKTSLAVDLAVSLGTGKPFLGHFPVPEQVRVAVFSGESGEATLQETARRVCAAKKVALGKHCQVLWSFRLPRLSRKADRDGLHRFLSAEEVKAVFIDPLYLCLLAGGQGASASNLFETGPLLQRVAGACLAAGATPIFIHHTTKSAGKKEGPPDLDDLAFSGVAEFVRQWVLLSRRAPYQPGTGRHDLRMMVGGSAGQSGDWQVNISEGLLDNQFRGRKWSVKVSALGLESPAVRNGTGAARSAGEG